MNIGSNTTTQDPEKVKRWNEIKNIIERKSILQKGMSMLDDNSQQKRDDVSVQSRKSIQISNQDLQMLQLSQNSPQSSLDRRLSQFSTFQRFSQPKKDGILQMVINNEFKKKMQSNSETTPQNQVETNIPSFNNLNNNTPMSSTNLQRLTSFNQNHSQEMQNELSQTESQETNKQNLDNNDDDAVNLKDLEQMEGEFQIKAQEFLLLVNDPTYDPTEKLIEDQLAINKKQYCFQNQLTLIIHYQFVIILTSILFKKIGQCLSKSLCCFIDNLNAKIYDSENLQKMKKKQKLPSEIIPVISPDSPFRITWDILCMILIVYAIIMVPFRMSFDPDDKFTDLSSIDSVFDYIFMLDILLNFNTAVYVMGNLIKDRRVIFVEYIKLWFWLDFFSSFPYELVVSDALKQQDIDEQQDQQSNSSSSSSVQSIKQAQKFVKMLKFFRLMKVLKLLRVAKLKLIVEKLVEYLKLSKSMLGMLGFLKLSSIVLFIAHWIACMWHLVGSQNNEESWIIVQGIENESWDVKYISSIYWAITTMVTVGYGDITPKNKEEKIFTIFIMLLACGIFAYTMNTMGTVLSEIESFSYEYKNEMQSVNRYLDSKKVKLQLKIRIRKYLEYVYESKQKNQIDETNLLSKLSSSLKNDLIHQINQKVIDNCYIFTELFDKENLQQFLFQISINLQEKITIPEEIIIDQVDNNREDDNCMYFIQDGEVEIFFQHSNKKTILKKIGSGSYFGELSFFTDMHRSASVQSVNFASLYYLKRTDFLKILQKFPNQRVNLKNLYSIYIKKELQIYNLIFFEISDKIKNYNNYTGLNLTCYSCQKQGHIAASCTNLSFQFFKSRYIEKLLSNYKKDEINFTRNKKQKFQSLKDQKRLEEPSLKLQQTPLILAFIRCYNIDNDIDGEQNKQIFNTQNSFILKKKVDNSLVGKVQQSIFKANSISKPEKKQKQKQSINNSQNDYFMQMNYWKQVEEFDKVKIYEHYFTHNNAKQGETEDDQMFKHDNNPKSNYQINKDQNTEGPQKIAPLIMQRRKFQSHEIGQQPLNMVEKQGSSNQIQIKNVLHQLDYSSSESSDSDISPGLRESGLKESLRLKETSTGQDSTILQDSPEIKNSTLKKKPFKLTPQRSILQKKPILIIEDNENNNQQNQKNQESQSENNSNPNIKSNNINQTEQENTIGIDSEDYNINNEYSNNTIFSPSNFSTQRQQISHQCSIKSIYSRYNNNKNQ